MKVSGQLVKTHTLPHIFLAAEICRVRRQRWTRFTPIVLMMCGANTTTITLRLTSSIIEVKEEPFLSLLHLHMLIHTHTQWWCYWTHESRDADTMQELCTHQLHTGNTFSRGLEPTTLWFLDESPSLSSTRATTQEAELNAIQHTRQRQRQNNVSGRTPGQP